MSRRPKHSSENYDDWKKAIVDDTLAWITAIGATIDGGEVFTVAQWAKAFGYISENGTPNHEVWAIVKDDILCNRGLPLAQKFMQGHYLGNPGDQASILLSGFHQIYGRSRRLKIQRDKLAGMKQQAPLIVEQINQSIGPAAAQTMMQIIEKVSEAFGPEQEALRPWKQFLLGDSEQRCLRPRNDTEPAAEPDNGARLPEVAR